MDVKHDELLRLVVALSSACKKDKNVLKDGELVDALELHGRQIARLREKLKTLTTVDRSPMKVSPLCKSGHETVEKVDQQLVAGEIQVVDGVLKRRKVSLRTKSYDKSAGSLVESHDETLESSCRFPSITGLPEPKRESIDEWISSLQSQEQTMMMMDPVDAAAHDPSTTPTTVEVTTAGVSDDAVMVKPVKVYQYSQGRRNVSPQLKTSPAVRPASSPKQQFYRAASPKTVDLTASSASTMASYYDDVYDEYATCPESMQRCSRSVVNRAMSFETTDWMPLYDDCSDESTSFRSFADDVAQRSPVSRSAAFQRSGHAVDAQLNVFDLRSEKSSINVSYSADEGPPAADVSPRVNALKRKNKPLVVLSSTEVVMEVLYGIMEHNEKFKWLIDPVNQARVASLVKYHLRERRNGNTSMYEDKQLVYELRAQVDELIHENLKIKTENVRLSKNVSQSVAVDRTVEELRRRLERSEEAVSMREEYHRESEATFHRELESKSKLMARLQHDLAEKDSQIALLLEHNAQSPPTSSFSCEEVSGLKDAVSEKDREICRLNLHLSTKRELVAEIAERVARHLESTLSVSPPETVATLVQGLRLDMDMLLFQSVAEKQKVICELKAALSSVQREVSELEARLAKKECDTLQLKSKFQSVTSRLTYANVNMSRVQTENDRLVALLKEKQGQMHELIEFLEGKEKQVMHLEEQASLRETRLGQAGKSF